MKDNIKYCDCDEKNLLFTIAELAAKDINHLAEKIIKGKTPNSKEELEAYYSLEFAHSNLAEFLNCDMDYYFTKKINDSLRASNNLHTILDEMIQRNTKKLLLVCSDLKKKKNLDLIENYKNQLKDLDEEAEEIIHDQEMSLAEASDMLTDIGKDKEELLLKIEKLKGIIVDNNNQKEKSKFELERRLEYYNKNFEKIYGPFMNKQELNNWLSSKEEIIRHYGFQ